MKNACCIFQVLARERYDEDTHAYEKRPSITSVLSRHKAKLSALGIQRPDSLPGCHYRLQEADGPWGRSCRRSRISTKCVFGLDHKYFLFPERLACAVYIVGSQINVLGGH